MMAQDNLHFAPGTLITGKWHRNQYQLVKWLGSGAQGTVYLGREGRRMVAIKLAKDRASLISEVNVLKQFEKLQGDPLGPSLYDSDDWLTRGRTIGFCVMEYLDGISLADALKRKPFDWTLVYMLQLLKQLQQLHRSGYIFGDLKPENLILIHPGHSIRCLDFGGATRIGRSVREYTEFYDRGYWGFGGRRAEPSYDLFACVMILIYAAAGKRIVRTNEPQVQLVQFVKSHPKLAPYRKIAINAMRGSYPSAEAMRRELLQEIMTSRQSEPRSPQTRRTIRKTNTSSSNSWKSAWLAASVLLTAYILFVIIYVM
ncbi:MAG: protein kinase [Sporolactobacillus sp.]|uniref:protein kinase domain-containing protein n=1 Tax=Sporolactobacillus sp. STSJ-5 TaxID=2965076 RepID=UPI0021078C40|nr:protein kinase [Sporolactobacillus sp. STSJ-5]MCQ2011248.1 protein kinase [Sporolactobacillus sp. STSJ-5]